jgi:hypothetical protein
MPIVFIVSSLWSRGNNFTTFHLSHKQFFCHAKRLACISLLIQCTRSGLNNRNILSHSSAS